MESRLSDEQKKQMAADWEARRAYLASLPPERKCYLCGNEIAADEPGVHRGKTTVHNRCADRASRD